MELDDPDTGALTVPQLMTVGTGTPQMFACAGLRTEDDTARSTWLIEIFPPNSAAGGASGGAARVQDMLYGDDPVAPNARGGPLVGPANPIVAACERAGRSGTRRPCDAVGFAQCNRVHRLDGQLHWPGRLSGYSCSRLGLRSSG